jgi:arylamine N-acetyltransferase
MREEDRRAAIRLIDSFGLRNLSSGAHGLEEIYERLRALPYENLTKLLRKHSGDPPSSWPRLPEEVVRDYLAWRSGGTCFSLTKLLETVLLEAGFRCHPVLADMPHGREIHCALVVHADHERYLLDPSYLLPKPMKLPVRGQTSLRSPASVLVLEGESATTYRLFTRRADQPPKWRYTFRDEPATENRFMSRWMESFDQTMMNSLVMTTLSYDRQLYLHNDRLQEVGLESRRTTALREDYADALGHVFGIDESLARKAHQMWLDVRKGGPASSRGTTPRQARQQRSGGAGEQGESYS